MSAVNQAVCTDLLLATIRKNGREEFRIAIRQFKGVRRVDLRVYAENGAREFVATAKGCSIAPALLRQVIGALELAERAARAEGLIP